MSLLVSGEIEFPQNTEPFSGATAYVSLESAAMLDMPSTVLAETVLKNLSYQGSNLEFEIKGTLDSDVEGSLRLRVHVSLHGSDDVKQGDYLTKRSHTVRAGSLPESALVSVEKV